MPVTILLANRYPVFREGLKAVLENHEDWRVIGETGNGLDATKLVERLRPDLLIVDIMMPSLGGLEVTRQVCQRLSRTHVIVLSRHANETYVLEALRNGAAGHAGGQAGDPVVHLGVAVHKQL